MSSRLRNLFNLDRQLRIYLRFIIESFAVLSVYISYLFISNVFEQFSLEIHVLNAFIWIFAYKTLGLNKDRLRFSSIASYLPILQISLVSSLLLGTETWVLTGSFNVISLLLYFLLSFNILVGFRVLARQLMRKDVRKSRENILVYGTSDIAIDLANAMAFGKKYNVVGFISDKPESIGSLAGLTVVPLIDVAEFVRLHACKLVVLASDTLTPARQTEVLLKLDELGLSVSLAPTMDRAFDYEVKLKAVKPEDVLGRASAVQFDVSVQAELANKTVLVTGAGGSIGSEICRQILRYQPKKLIILELSEIALYTLDQELSELREMSGLKTQVHYHLGSVTDDAMLSRIFNEQKIDVVYHAAAYKHVPIIEDNVIAGITNNVFGTKCVADFAHRFGIDKFVLVSTDKAVRPTNVMGASKRLAELVILDLARSSETIFTMVRFGNVLGSSGSVIPKFKSQISAGGPITVTHEEVMRYFMSIPEAAHLVLSAGTFANGGDVFLLDMGPPVKILDLARSMVRQHGLQPVLTSEIEGQQQRDNEILIEFSGLRPGEKLYEELLIDGIAEETPNPKIFKSNDGSLEDLDVSKVLGLLLDSMKYGDTQELINQLLKLPLSYTPNIAADPKVVNNFEIDQAENRKPENSSEKQTPSYLVADQGNPSILKKILSSTVGLAVLHYYFLFTRGMTLGVRVIIQNTDNEILLVKHTYTLGWYLPGGGVDRGESVCEAILREVYEECGIDDLRNLRLLNIAHNSKMSEKDHVAFYSATTTQNVKIKNNLEIEIAKFFPLDALPVDVDHLCISALDEISSFGTKRKKYR